VKINKEDILNTGNLELLAKKAVEGFITGYHKSPFHGFSVEFAEHRQYNNGESTKNIDWKLYGRTDKLFVKRYEEETNLRCQIIIDTSSSMQIEHKEDLSKLQYAVWCTAVFLQMLKKQRDASGMCFFDEKVNEYTKIASSSRHYRELLFKLEPYLTYDNKNKPTNIANVLHSIANQLHKRSLVVLFTDFFEHNRDVDHLFDAIKHLKYNNHEVIVFHTVHKPSEVEFDFPSVPMSFQDAESGEILKVQPAEIKNQYQKAIKEYNQYIKLKMSQYKVDFVVADTSETVAHALIPFLVKRRKMST
jgi:uncharacterized protein (DUF58 family)